ncbi:hypothetical protein L596_008215 [Steinernema carpocapsae]|uniref:Dipeptidylpeptidase IV N-terminal domain-containing protein n=1 Tax=Steinernema carpocapsae TaxID=34508 RepID=A0A4V6A6C5_STECR|nr:hypothetical protein L596_008215 [Steinernema carpocapsae]
MPPTEKSSPVVRRPILLWPELLEHARCWRSESRKFAHNPISDVEFVFDQDDQPKIFALGAFDQGSVQQTILSTTLSDTMAHIEVKRDFAPISSDASEDDENEEECEEMPPLPDYSIIPENSPQTMLEPIFQPLTTLRNPADVPKEIAMMCERMRTNVMNGVTDFSYSANGKCILYDSSLNLNLLKLTENETQPIGKWCDGVPLNAQLSPVDPSLTAFVANSELHVDRNGRKYHSTVAPSHTVINGASSFIAQEELDRFEGFWWSPTKPELIYESVDEGKVSELTFECPGKPLTGLMRYPLAGTRNAISRLRLLNCADETPVDSPLAFELTDIYPGYEYLARVGWIPSGSGIYAQLMNRLQTQSVLVFFPRTVFTKPSSISNVEEIKKEVHILYSESCPNDAWINVNNLLSPLPQVYGGETTKRFIYGSEKTGNNHLYFHIYSKDSAGCPVADIYPITHGEWNVVRDSPVSIDHNRQLVYFLANLHDPTTTNLCVASYAKNASEEPRSLTPRHLTYRNDRSKSKLCLHMDYGFVCWLSSISQPPECYVYRFKYFECGDKTPVAVLHSRLVLPKPSNILNAYSDFRLTMDTSVFDSIPEHSKPLIHSYVSKNSDIPRSTTFTEVLGCSWSRTVGPLGSNS